MQAILSNYTASITELKKSPSDILKKAGNQPVAILNHNTPSAYLVPANTYEQLIELIDEYMLSKEVNNRLKDDFIPIEVSLDEL
jgi:antitoxin StbD